ncbi:CU044_5270 family protein [Nonomuraea sp. NPDC059194]|uniref:CU044_5270 family protein n=1 Tax=Nonomuraea sp. NPDC059194 TaxID=3346764 RepID=UPI0036CABD16
MNEIDLLNQLRSEIPNDPDVRAEERRLLTAIRTQRARRAPRAPRYRIGLALAAACAAAVAAVAVVNSGGDHPAPPVTVQKPDTLLLLERAALVAAKRQDLRPDQWTYRKEEQGRPGMPFEVWIRGDGRKEAVRQNGKLNQGDGEKGSMYPAKTQRMLEALPADPEELLRHFGDSDKKLFPMAICLLDCPADSQKDVNAFGAIGWYLKYGPMVPADKAAAMYRALAKIPGVTVQENVKDGAGRTGVGVVLDLGQAGKGTYVLDPADYRYLGMLVERDGRTLTDTVLASGVVDGPGQVP